MLVTIENVLAVDLAIGQPQFRHRAVSAIFPVQSVPHLLPPILPRQIIGTSNTPSGKIAPEPSSNCKLNESDKKPWLQRLSVSASLVEKQATKSASAPRCCKLSWVYLMVDLTMTTPDSFVLQFHHLIHGSPPSPPPYITQLRPLAASFLFSTWESCHNHFMITVSLADCLFDLTGQPYDGRARIQDWNGFVVVHQIV